MTISLEEAATLAGGHCWAERRLFEIVGGWVASTPEPAVKLMLDRHAQNHAWRAAQWWDRLPVLADVDRDSLVAAPGAPVAAAMESLRTLDGTVPRLAGAYRVLLPRLFAAYGRHRAAASPVSDGSTLRTLGIVGPDLASDWGEGEVTLQRLLCDEAAVDAAAGAVRRLELLLGGPGGLLVSKLAGGESGKPDEDR